MRDSDSSQSAVPSFGGWSPEQDESSEQEASGRTGASFPWTVDQSGEPRDEGWSLAAPVVPPTGEPKSPESQGDFPVPGQDLAGFRIVSELGRGAYGRVYLAEQEALGRRQVALKVSRALGKEPLRLAQLQHTHIVPVFSVHDDPHLGFRILCMPYFGGANLAEILSRAGARVPTQVTGRSLLDALDRLPHRSIGARSLAIEESVDRESPESGALQRAPDRPRIVDDSPEFVHPSRIRSGVGRYLARRLGGSGEEAGVDAGPSNRGAAANSTSQTKQCSAGRPARDYFETHSYVQTCVWIAARLAEALEHAHLRGILHRDLKPSNILIAADGTPMLLDFNLAVVVGEAGDSKASRLGGTVPYMSPEHLDAFNPMGNTRPEAVNERSDLYSLGLILYEMLAGILPFGDTPTDLRASWVMTQLLEERRKGVPSVRRHNPHVPYNLDSILRTCLDAKPERRYPSATVFAEDLRRFLEHRPLLHAPEPSPRERLKNWGKRHPRLSSAGSVGALTLFIIAMIAGGMQALSRSLAAAESRLAHTAFRHEFDRCQVFLNARRGAKAEWKQGIDRALSALRRYGVARGAPTDWLHGPLVRNLPSESQLALREEVAELAASLARARVNSIDVSARESRRRALEQAVGWLDRVEAIDPRPTAVLFRERAAYLEELGDETRAARDRKRALTLLPQTARDYSLIGEELASSGSIDQAIPFLERAIVIDPRRFWAWFVLGLCHYELGQFEAAAGEFGACMLIEPQFAWPAFNRGLALARAGRFTEARLAYDRAISLDPELIEARLNRALVDLERGAYGIALSDLDQVIASGHVTAAVHAARAEALDRLGRQPESEAEFAAAISLEPKNASLLVARGFARVRGAPDQAAEDFRQALRVEPESSRARLGLAMVLRHEDPARAIELLDQALERDASLHEALQLRAIERARRGDRGALEDIDRLERSPSALNLYNAACALCLLAERGQAGDLSRAAVLLRRAMDRGASASTIDRDPDLEILKREGHWPPKSELKTGPNHAAEAGGASTAA